MKELKIEDFDELKRLAYKAALEGRKVGYTEDLEQKYIESYFQGSIVWGFRRLVAIYRSYLTGKKTESESRELINNMHEDFKMIVDFLERSKKADEAIENTFKSAGIKQISAGNRR